MNVQSQPHKIMDKREQILDATADLIAEQGLQACPMSMIAKHACCGAGTIYRYFETKEELVQELFRELSSNMAEQCLQGYDENAGIKQRFFTFWGNFYRFMHDTPRNRTLMEQLTASPAICEAHRQTSMQIVHDTITRLLKEGKEQQLIKDMPDEILTTMTFGGLLMTSRKQHLAPEMFTAEVDVKDLVTMCWDAIKA